jgi:manganese oxidase
MDGMQKKVLFGGIFVILALSVMFFDGLFHIDFNSKPSGALTHAAHGAGHDGDEHSEMSEMDHDAMEMDGMDHSEHDAGAPQAMASSLAGLPKRSPDNAVNDMPYIINDGIKEFQLTVDDIMWEYGEGKYVHAWGYNGQVPGPVIRVTEGDKVRVVVKNNLDTPTTVHWHGVDVENEADGVPGFTQYPIKPGDTYTYEFTANPAGTRWYHSHGFKAGTSVTQVDMGLAGAFIIEPKDTTDARHSSNYDREYIYMLDEWEIAEDGTNGALKGLSASGEHVHEVHSETGGPAYNTFTINGRVYPDIPPLKVKEGETIILRLVNNGVQEFHPMHTHGHSFKVIATDGNLLSEGAQYWKDTINLNPAERYDIVIKADNPGAWLFHCHQLHHAAAGMVVAFLYEGHEPCCMDGEETESHDDHMEAHATQEAVDGCFGHHTSKEAYASTLAHCIEDICGTDDHCFAEVEAMAIKYK